MEKHLLLIDGNSLFFKSFYASYKRLQDGHERLENGEPINAIRLFAFMIINLRQKNENTDILVAFDARNIKTYRHEYSFYKANRKKQPDELYAQIPVAKEFLDLFGIKWIESKYEEADDIIGIYAHEAKKLNYKIDIITSDKDLLQLVDENVDVYLSKTGISNMQHYTNENFNEKFFGLSPIQIPDLKGLMGDTSDNISGIYGIGEKTAISLLKQYYSLERIFSNVEEIKGALKDKIIFGKDKGEESKSLAKIKLEKDLNSDLEINFLNLAPKEPSIYLKDFLFKKNLFNVIEKIYN